MTMRRILVLTVFLLLTRAAFIVPQAKADDVANGKAAHVVLLSIDGFHQLDLETYIAAHPNSTLAALVGRGTEYTNTTSSRPSDSFPGTLAMTTGGSPSSTGIYYDVSWDDLLSPPGS